MEIILQRKVPNLGNIGDRVSVKNGYGRNYLLPQGLAVTATENNVAKFEARRSELEKQEKDSFEAAQKRASQLADLEVKISAQASDEGKLYGSIGTAEIARAITEHGVSIQKKEVNLPNGVLRTIGEYTIQLSLHSDVSVPVKLQVLPA